MFEITQQVSPCDISDAERCGKYQGFASIIQRYFLHSKVTIIHCLVNEKNYITKLQKANSHTPKGTTIFYRYTAHIGKGWKSGFLFQFSWRKIFFNLCILIDRQTTWGSQQLAKAWWMQKNVVSFFPGLPPARCIAPDLWGLTSSVNSIANDPSLLLWKIISALSEEGFLKTENITVHTHWTESCF